MKSKVFFVTVLTFLSMAVAGSGAASAEGPSATLSTSSPVTAAWPSVTATSNTPGQSGVAAVITCTLNVQAPHNSTHVPGTVNVVTRVTCTAPVPRIAIRAALYRNGGLVKDSGSKDFFGTSVAQNNAAESCHVATYQGWGSFYVVFPTGYAPPTGSGSAFGPTRSITAC